MIVRDIMEITNQKRGTVEQFRNELSKCGLISNNEELDIRAVEVFKKSIGYKEENSSTWSKAMQRAIQEEYGEEMVLPFTWSPNIILKNLIWEINNDYVEISKGSINSGDVDFHVIYEIIIDNFKELGKSIEVYSDSFGTDGNPITTYKCVGKNYIYYVVGKYNHITKQEDVHVFYNDGNIFNIMKCTHICGGDANKGKISELLQTCRIKYLKESE